MKRLLLILPLVLSACTEPDETNLIGRWESKSEICKKRQDTCGLTISLRETAASSVYAKFDDRKVEKNYQIGEIAKERYEIVKGAEGPLLKRKSVEVDGTVFSIAFNNSNQMLLVYKNGKLYYGQNLVWERVK